MARMLDGEQKISDWPEEAKKHIRENPNSNILVGQSMRSQHTLLACKLIGKRIFISYNKKLKCFVSWNILANIGDSQKGDDVQLKLSSKCLRQFESNPIFTAFYEGATGTGQKAVFQKICVFPESDFVKFYSGYERYMKPCKSDSLFQTPVADF